MSSVRVVSGDTRAILGEGPIWVEKSNAVFWVDIFGQRVYRLDLGDESISRWEIPERIGWIVERAGTDDFIAGLKSGFALLSLDPFLVKSIGNPEPDRPQNRLNDAKVDRYGRIWAGSMDDAEVEPTGALYRLDPDFRWSRHDDGYLVTNGPTFSLDGTILYHAESFRRMVYAFDLDEEGNLTGKRVFVQFEEKWGYPDGMTTDSEGGIWIAHWAGGRISRFTPDGRLDRFITIPATNVTSIVFAGENLDRAFVTSAAHGCGSEPLAGALFEVETNARGLRATPFTAAAAPEK